ALGGFLLVAEYVSYFALRTTDRRNYTVPVPPCRELSPNFGDGRGRSGGGGCGLTVGRLGDDLDPVVECHTENEFWQLVGAVETAPAFLRGFQQFEDHRERGPVGQAALRSDRAVAHGGEGAFNGVGGP